MKKIEKEKKETWKNEAFEKLLKNKTLPKKEKTKSKQVAEKSGANYRISQKKSITRKAMLIGVISLGCILAVSVVSFYYYRNHKKESVSQSAVAGSNNSPASNEQSLKDVIGKIMELPTDEEPVVATVTDIEKIKGQKFFAHAQNGDRVLIYTNNKKAILYRESSGKIIEVSSVSGLNEGAAPTDNQPAAAQNNTGSPVTDGQTSTTDVPAQNNQTSSEAPATVAVYNGATTKGLAQKIGDVVSQLNGVTVVAKKNAVGNYEKTIVIDLSNTHPELVKKMAETLKGETGTLPEGETKPDADILVIGGSDFSVN